MGIRERVLAWLARGGDDLDPDAFVEFALVHLAEGPMLVARLQRAGIEARGHESVNPATRVLSDYSVRVRRRDLAAATAAASDV